MFKEIYNNANINVSCTAEDIANKLADRAMFMYGFSKNEQENISSKDIDGLKKLAVHYMAAGSVILQRAVKLGELEEIT